MCASRFLGFSVEILVFLNLEGCRVAIFLLVWLLVWKVNPDPFNAATHSHFHGWSLKRANSFKRAVALDVTRVTCGQGFCFCNAFS
jgi:hypothetical protein